MIPIPYKGVPPKDEDQRINKIPKRFDKTIIDSDPEPVLRGIDLPPTAPQGVPWCEQTRIWWKNWRLSPQAKLMGPTDWDFLLDTAVMHNQIWRDRMVMPDVPRGGSKFFDGLSPTAMSQFEAEIRQRVGKFGATWEDRQKLQLQITTPQTDDETDKMIEAQAEIGIDYLERLKAKVAEKRGDGEDVNDNPDG